MTNKEQKDIFAIAMATILIAVIIAIGVMKDINMYHDVDQFIYVDGTKITIDWSKHEKSNEYKNVSYFYGCINDGLYANFWWMSAEQWHARIFEKDSECERTFGGPVKEWRW